MKSIFKTIVVFLLLVAQVAGSPNVDKLIKGDTIEVTVEFMLNTNAYSSSKYIITDKNVSISHGANRFGLVSFKGNDKKLLTEWFKQLYRAKTRKGKVSIYPKYTILTRRGGKITSRKVIFFEKFRNRKNESLSLTDIEERLRN